MRICGADVIPKMGSMQRAIVRPERLKVRGDTLDDLAQEARPAS